MHGYDLPIYTNIIYPWPQDPKASAARAARRQPCRLATAPLSQCPRRWAGRPVLLHFDGVDSAFYVWVNGQKVGYSEDSRTPAEFDLAPHVQPGANVLAVEVYRLQRRRLSRRPGHVAHVAASSATCISGRRAAHHVRDFEVKTDARRGVPRRDADRHR